MTLAARQATLQDLGFIQRATAAAYDEYAPLLDRPPVPVAEDYAPRIAQGGVHVISDGEADVAAITLELHEDHLFIFSLAVVPGQQGRGVGRWMLAFAEAQARAASRPEIRLYTNSIMTRNIELYLRHGYEERGRHDNPARPGWIAVHMAKPV